MKDFMSGVYEIAFASEPDLEQHNTDDFVDKLRLSRCESPI